MDGEEPTNAETNKVGSCGVHIHTYIHVLSLVNCCGIKLLFFCCQNIYAVCDLAFGVLQAKVCVCRGGGGG